MYCEQRHIISGKGIANFKNEIDRIDFDIICRNERLNVQIPSYTITISQLS